jgi:leucine dehydrogenase
VGTKRRVSAGRRAAGVAPPTGGAFDLIAAHAHEQVSYWYDPVSGYRGIIAIHSTALGPGLGGTRVWDYASDTEALVDVLRLARGMTYKAAVAGLDLGGGKAVILGAPPPAAREAVFRAHGRHVESLGGRYLTAEDVGTSPADMAHVARETRYVTGLPGRSGDPSPVTALGVFRAMQGGAKFVWGRDGLAGRTVAVQGVGHVGYALCGLLHADGARLVVTDVDAARVRRAVTDFGARAVGVDAIYGVDADVFAPCALGAVINDRTLRVLRAQLICGGANNVLAEERHGDAIERRGIVYVPDYVANAGGIINIYQEVAGWTAEQSHAKAGEIYETALRVLAIARDERIPSYRAADRLAEQRLAAAEKAKGLPRRV